jgi:tRNA(Met) C34 N-acetyltransferase TmcA
MLYRKIIKYENGETYIIEKNTKYAWLYTLLFGVFYFLYHKVYSHALISFFIGLITSGLSWLVYPFFANSIMEKFWLENGYEPVKKLNEKK